MDCASDTAFADILPLEHVILETSPIEKYETYTGTGSQSDSPLFRV